MTSGIQEARQELTDRIIDRDGVSGTAIGERDGSPCLLVYVTDSGAAGGIPGKFRGFPVVVEETGTFRPR